MQIRKATPFQVRKKERKIKFNVEGKEKEEMTHSGKANSLTFLYEKQLPIYQYLRVIDSIAEK